MRNATPLKFLFPGWYAIVMGLAGLSLAFHRAEPLMGEPALGAALALGALAAAVFVVLAAATVLRGMRYPEAWAEDRRHPVRHTFIATLPVAIILLATVAVFSGLRGPLAGALWWVGSLAQLFITAWVLARWWKGNQPGGLQWAGVTPALIIPIVGNVLAPLAGVPLGWPEWSAAQFGIGLLFWPMALTLLFVRVGVQGLWAERLLPTTFILVAPPAVIGLSALQLGAPAVVGWVLWGITLFTFVWVAALGKRISKLPVGLTHWGMVFPLAAFASLTMRMAGTGALAMLGVAVLALVSLLAAALSLATLRGLRDGSLLVPEQVAIIVPEAEPNPSAKTV
jgi:tellurite resistance protein